MTPISGPHEMRKKKGMDHRFSFPSPRRRRRDRTEVTFRLSFSSFYARKEGGGTGLYASLTCLRTPGGKKEGTFTRRRSPKRKKGKSVHFRRGGKSKGIEPRTYTYLYSLGRKKRVAGTGLGIVKKREGGGRRESIASQVSLFRPLKTRGGRREGRKKRLEELVGENLTITCSFNNSETQKSKRGRGPACLFIMPPKGGSRFRTSISFRPKRGEKMISSWRERKKEKKANSSSTRRGGEKSFSFLLSSWSGGRKEEGRESSLGTVVSKGKKGERALRTGHRGGKRGGVIIFAQ